MHSLNLYYHYQHPRMQSMDYSTFSLIKVMRRFLQTDNLQQNSHLKTSGRYLTRWLTRCPNCNSLPSQFQFAKSRNMHSSSGRVFSIHQKYLHSLEQILLGSLCNIFRDSSEYTIDQNRTNLKQIDLHMFVLMRLP